MKKYLGILLILAVALFVWYGMRTESVIGFECEDGTTFSVAYRNDAEIELTFETGETRVLPFELDDEGEFGWYHDDRYGLTLLTGRAQLARNLNTPEVSSVVCYHVAQ